MWARIAVFGVSASVFFFCLNLNENPVIVRPFVLFVARYDVGMLVYLFNGVSIIHRLKLSDLVYSSSKTPKRFLNSASSIT